METTPIRRSRASSSKSAREYRQRGHDDALEFAHAIGMSNDYKNDIKAKKDVIDPSGDGHSVKGGAYRWQIFLYSKNHFEEDDSFKVMNGIGDLLIECVNSFPPSFLEYQQNKAEAKAKLRVPMVKLAEKLQSHARLRAFMGQSMFCGTQVNYLTVKHDGVFHVFWHNDVITAMADNFEVCNSKAIAAGQTPEQKVLFRYKGLNVGELEMRNDSPTHYQEIRFNMIKPKIMNLLFEKIPQTGQYNEKVLIYGNAAKHFGRWLSAPKLVPV